MSELEERTKRFVDFDRLMLLSEPRKFREKAFKLVERKQPAKIETPKVLPISDRIVELARPFIRDQPIDEALITRRRFNQSRINELAAPKSAQAVNQDLAEEKFAPKRTFSSQYFTALSKPKPLCQRLYFFPRSYMPLISLVFVEYQSNRRPEEFYTPKRSALLAQATERINQLAVSRARLASEQLIFDENAYEVNFTAEKDSERVFRSRQMHSKLNLRRE